MNTFLKSHAFAALCFLVVLTSCSKKGSDTNTTNNNNTTVAVISGNWTISSYTQKAEDKTSLFDGYIFNFSSGGALSATKNAAATTGSWSFTPGSVGYYGGASSDASFTINLGTSNPLSRLSKIWNVDSTKSSSTKLSLINPEPLDDERVSFTKQ